MLSNHFFATNYRNILLSRPSSFRTAFRSALPSMRKISDGPRYFPTVFGEPAEVEIGVVHFGVGRFHRAHQAVYFDEILQRGGYKWGICGVCMLPQDEDIYNALKKQNGEYNVLEMDSTTTCVKKVGSLVEVLWGHKQPEDVLYTLGRNSVKIVTITVSEAGYFYHPATKSLDFSHEAVAHDLELYRAALIHLCSPTADSGTITAQHPNPRTIFGYLAIGMLRRYLNKVKPFTVLSCDNIQGNGDILKSLLIEFCEKVGKSELKKVGKYNRFLKWLHSSVTFPNSMVDRITPAASEEEIDYIRYPIKDYLDFIPVRCEFYRQWVIEDNFCNIKPKFQTLKNVSLVTDIKPYEKIKIRCLNGGHSAIGYAGFLADFEKIDDVVDDELFQQYLRLYFKEVSVTLDEVEGLELSEYQDELIERFSNHKIRDDVLRICKDGSSKIPGFIMPTIGEVIEKKESSKCLSFVVACWISFIDKQYKLNAALDDSESSYLFELAEKLSASRVNDTDRTPTETGVGVFLEEEWLFGEVGKNTLFATQVQEAYTQITNEGVVIAMKALVGGQGGGA